MKNVISITRSRLATPAVTLLALGGLGATTVLPMANAARHRRHHTSKHKRHRHSHREPDADNRGGPDDGDGAK